MMTCTTTTPATPAARRQLRRRDNYYHTSSHDNVMMEGNAITCRSKSSYGEAQVQPQCQTDMKYGGDSAVEVHTKIQMPGL